MRVIILIIRSANQGCVKREQNSEKHKLMNLLIRRPLCANTLWKDVLKQSCLHLSDLLLSQPLFGTPPYLAILQSCRLVASGVAASWG